MQGYEVIFLSNAQQDLDDIVSYITQELMKPDSAARLLDVINKRGKSLAYLPRRFPLVNDARLAKKAYRMMPVENYHLFYRIHEKKKLVSIVRIVYNRRDWARLL